MPSGGLHACCSSLSLPLLSFHLWLHLRLMWKNFDRSHTHTHRKRERVSGEGTAILFVSAGTGKWTGTHIVFKPAAPRKYLSLRAQWEGEDVFEGWCVLLELGGRGWVGGRGRLGSGHVGVFASSRNQSTAEPTIPPQEFLFSSPPYLFRLSLSFYSLTPSSPIFSPSCIHHTRFPASRVPSSLSWYQSKCTRDHGTQTSIPLKLVPTRLPAANNVTTMISDQIVFWDLGF